MTTAQTTDTEGHTMTPEQILERLEAAIDANDFERVPLIAMHAQAAAAVIAARAQEILAVAAIFESSIVLERGFEVRLGAHLRGYALGLTEEGRS